MNNLKIKNTDEIDWKLILSCWNTTKYVSKIDLVDLCLICKFMRNKLFPDIYRCIVLEKFSDGLDDLPLNIINSELEKEALDRYNEHLKDFIPHARCLFYICDYNEILLLSIPQVFYKLNRIQLADVSSTLNVFQKLMNGLTQLEHLSLEYSLLIVPKDTDNLITLKLPPNLITLKIVYGEIMRIEFDPSLIFSDYLGLSDESNTEILKFKIESGSLPKLKVLKITQDDQRFMETQNNLICASEQLTHLSTRFSLINEFSSNNLKSLISLTLTNNYIFPQNFVEIDFSTLKNLKELRIKGGFNLTRYDDVIIPGLQKLISIGKNVEILTLPYINFDNLSIEETIHNFPNLKELNLIKATNVETLSPTKFPKTLNTLNLCNFDPKTLDINNIKNCDELKVVSISYEEEYYNFFNFEDTKFAKGVKGWRIIHFYGSSIKCYKE
ncbi:hypothetical protein CONCODRAFT_69770 [Conidiobolus coronatus NRRL 28638]|uniref:RNI-like protein n=1 Tax=Conidiobolus coronatus (strain ATCC 28846 / CBS 209.66 / NRRL 28638) TaxID=796925 RepID=A0A137P9D5_CONC2|nr:hypothetical protein CONCODRAFT_69770 [Conidiobolus coronatus NRRL 28638]|eukprot:KXN71521.1 hypothetical protein CONCODRAFT_69770 [Conidiobolus coronatus NRRL 28638]